MKEFLAKTNPKESIQEHTDKLLENFNLLKLTYPNLNLDWDMLYTACLYHDLGKINKRFQDKLLTGKINNSEIPHGILSMAFIDYEDLEEKGYTSEDISILFHAIGYHHDRKLDFSIKDVDDEIELMKDDVEHFKYSNLKNLMLNDTIEVEFFVLKDRIYKKNGEEKFFKYIMIKGLLNRIDYAASAHLPVENKNAFLLDRMEGLLNNWKITNPRAEWNELQKFMISNRNQNTIVAAQTGMGKTEAGLLWIGDGKGFFVLPLKTAINSIYKRIITNIITNDFSKKVGLLHSNIMNMYLDTQKETGSEIDVQEYFERTKQLSLPLTVCTMDQIFDFVYRYKGFEPKLATLAYSKVVIDEIQMYSPELLSYLIVGIKYITQMGGKFSVLTATLPKFIVETLQNEGIEFNSPQNGPFIDMSMNRHSINVIKDNINAEYVKKLYKKNKVLVICNTVKKAQEVYKELKVNKLENINLLHSRFIATDRKDKEEEISKLGKKESKEYGIWISTQIVEASLDIDFDILITELSDLAGLFQRMGRCYRNRQLVDDVLNCHVFVGTDDKKCSGVGTIIDKDIFCLSRKSIVNKKGIFTEQEKMDLVNLVYSINSLKHTKYYKDLHKSMDYLKSIEDFEKQKPEIQKIFRNIDSESVIPIGIYEKNADVIKECISTINKKYDKNMDEKDRTKLKYRKIDSRNTIMGFTVNIRGYEVEEFKEQLLKINKYESIPIVKCKYDNKIGVVFLKEDKNKNSKANNMF